MESQDCNNFGFGIYLCNSSVSNMPAGESWCVVISGSVAATGGQIAYALNSESIYTRTLAAGNWLSWKKR